MLPCAIHVTVTPQPLGWRENSNSSSCRWPVWYLGYKGLIIQFWLFLRCYGATRYLPDLQPHQIAASLSLSL